MVVYLAISSAHTRVSVCDCGEWSLNTSHKGEEGVQYTHVVAGVRLALPG